MNFGNYVPVLLEGCIDENIPVALQGTFYYRAPLELRKIVARLRGIKAVQPPAVGGYPSLEQSIPEPFPGV